LKISPKGRGGLRLSFNNRSWKKKKEEGERRNEMARLL